MSTDQTERAEVLASPDERAGGHAMRPVTVPTPNELTCETLDEAEKLAEQWVRGDLDELETLRAWVRLRMRAYAEGGWEGERVCMVEWIAVDLLIDDPDARRLCDESGWAS